MIVTLPASDMEEERDCLEKLRGVPIQWAVPRGEANYLEGAVEVLVQDVQFFREARRFDNVKRAHLDRVKGTHPQVNGP